MKSENKFYILQQSHSWQTSFRSICRAKNTHAQMFFSLYCFSMNVNKAIKDQWHIHGHSLTHKGFSSPSTSNPQAYLAIARWTTKATRLQGHSDAENVTFLRIRNEQYSLSLVRKLVSNQSTCPQHKEDRVSWVQIPSRVLFTAAVDLVAMT